VALRNAINEGVIPGPRMLVSTMPLSATGGHGDVNGMSRTSGSRASRGSPTG